MIPVAAHGFPIVLAHRGGAAEAPENTSAAADHMVSLGVRHLETDAHATADGVVVLHHDATVDRTTDGAGAIAELTWEQVSRLRTPTGLRIPLLAEVLEDHPGIYLNIDAKTDDVVDPLLDVLAEHEAFGRVLIASFSERRLERVRATAPRPVVTSAGVSASARLVAAAQTATDPASWGLPGPDQGVLAVQVPEYFGPMPVVTQRFVATAHRAGQAVHVWTVNDPAQMVRLLDLGVDGLVTDRPTLARELLRSRGQWREQPAPEE